jgi:hypothetical protein
MYLWPAVDHEGEVLDILVQGRRDSRAALRLMRKLIKKQGFVPKLLVSDKLRSYASAFRLLRLTCPDSFDGEDTMKSSAICAVPIGMAIALLTISVSKCKMSSEVRASETKVTQVLAMDVGDIPGHQLRIYEEDTGGRWVHSGLSSW